MPAVVANGVDKTQAQIWAMGLVRSLTLEQWADANNQDTVVGSGCLKSPWVAQTELAAIAQAKASGGYVDYQPGSISRLAVRSATTSELALGVQGDSVIELQGIGKAGWWVVDNQGVRTPQGTGNVADGVIFKSLFVGHYNERLGTWVQDAVVFCGATCPG